MSLTLLRKKSSGLVLTDFWIQRFDTAAQDRVYDKAALDCTETRIAFLITTTGIAGVQAIVSILDNTGQKLLQLGFPSLSLAQFDRTDPTNFHVLGNYSPGPIGMRDVFHSVFNATTGANVYTDWYGEATKNNSNGPASLSSTHVGFVTSYAPGTYFDGAYYSISLTTRNIQYSRRIYTSDNDGPGALALDSSGNGYFTNNSITNGWTYSIGRLAGSSVPWCTSYNNLSPGQLVIDSSGNCICVGSNNGGLHLMQISSSNVILAQTVTGIQSEASVNGSGVTIDSNGDIYAVGGTASGATAIFKFTSSLTPVWCRKLSGITSPATIKTTSTALVIACESTTGGVSRCAVIARLPKDGTMAGVYGTYTYSEETTTVLASTVVANAYGTSSGSPPTQTRGTGTHYANTVTFDSTRTNVT